MIIVRLCCPPQKTSVSKQNSFGFSLTARFVGFAGGIMCPEVGEFSTNYRTITFTTEFNKIELENDFMGYLPAECVFVYPVCV